jgi:hypothetical protein
MLIVYEYRLHVLTYVEDITLSFFGSKHNFFLLS